MNTKISIIFSIMLFLVGCDFSSFLADDSSSKGENDSLTVKSFYISKSNNPVLSESIHGLISGRTIYLSIPSEFSGTNTPLIPTISCNTACSIAPDPSGGILFDDDFSITLSKSGYQSSVYNIILYVD